jgi:hypothetical protein
MKKHFLILLLLFSINSIKAQFAENNSIYATTELIFGNFRGGVDLNMNYVFKNKYSLKIGYSGHVQIAESTPEDYSVGVVNFLFGGFGFINHPYDQMHNYKLNAGRIYKLNEKGSVRLNLSGGLGYTIIRRPENWMSNPNALVENYTWNYKNHEVLSLIINPKLELILNHWYGLTLSPLIVLNTKSSYVGIGLGQMIGLLKKRLKD